MKSAALIGTPTGHLASGLIVETTVCAFFFFNVALVTAFLSSTGLRLGWTMKTLGHTWSRISCSTNSDCEALRMLKPARSSSRANVSEPPRAPELVVFVDPGAVDDFLLPPQAVTARTRAKAARSEE